MKFSQSGSELNYILSGRKHIGFYLITEAAFSPLQSIERCKEMWWVWMTKWNTLQWKWLLCLLWMFYNLRKKVMIHFRWLLSLNDFHITSELPVEWNGKKVIECCFYVFHACSYYSLCRFQEQFLQVYMKLQKNHKVLSVLWEQKSGVTQHET